MTSTNLLRTIIPQTVAPELTFSLLEASDVQKSVVCEGLHGATELLIRQVDERETASLITHARHPLGVVTATVANCVVLNGVCHESVLIGDVYVSFASLIVDGGREDGLFAELARWHRDAGWSAPGN